MTDTISLIKKAQEGDRAARDMAVEQNLGLVRSVANRFYGRGAEADDLFQIGAIGLLKAVDRFDPSFDVQFSTYAVPLIIGEIKRFLRDDGLIKVSRSLKDLARRAMQLQEAYRERYNAEPTLSAIADQLQITTEELAMALDAVSPAASLYQPADENGGLLIDKIGGESCEEQVLNTVLTQQLLASLDKREQLLLQLRYFQNKTQSETAKRLGVSQVQVSRLEKKILAKLKQAL